MCLPGDTGSGRTFLCNRLETSRRSEEHTSELQSLRQLVCRPLLEKRKALTALKLRGQITGDLRLSVHNDHHVSSEDLPKRKSDDPLAGLVNIGAVIDAAEEADE